MKGPTPFDPGQDAPLLSAYVDGELSAEDAARVERHLAEDPRARRLVEQFRSMKSLTGAMRLQEPPPENWEVFWRNHYNRVERSLGWFLLILGAAIVGGWGCYRLASAVWDTAALPLPIKVGLFGVGAGLLVLVVSALRESLFKRKLTRYKDVIR